MAKKTIKHAFFRYGVPNLIDGKQVVDASGHPVYLEAYARLGETVDVTLKDDLERGEKFDAFEEPVKKSAAGSGE